MTPFTTCRRPANQFRKKEVGIYRADNTMSARSIAAACTAFNESIGAVRFLQCGGKISRTSNALVPPGGIVCVLPGQQGANESAANGGEDTLRQWPGRTGMLRVFIVPQRSVKGASRVVNRLRTLQDTPKIRIPHGLDHQMILSMRAHYILSPPRDRKCAS
jgi:hypothetical protein